MTPFLSVFDLSLPVVNRIRDYVLKSEFKDVTNPVDGVTYPGIAEIDFQMTAGITNLLESVLHREVYPRLTFARMMPYGVQAPHKVHDDHIMGQYSAHLYLSQPCPPEMGTAFYKDWMGGDRFLPLTEYATLPYNDMAKWEQYIFVPAAYGRLLIHKSELWHCAHPCEGFGSSPEDARLVLTCFFDLA